MVRWNGKEYEGNLHYKIVRRKNEWNENDEWTDDHYTAIAKLDDMVRDTNDRENPIVEIYLPDDDIYPTCIGCITPEDLGW